MYRNCAKLSLGAFASAAVIVFGLGLTTGPAYATHDAAHATNKYKDGITNLEQRVWDCENGLGACPDTPGPQGMQGKLGPQGDQGAQGKLGPRGDQGVQGKLGPRGDQGVQGKLGDTGPQGAQGKLGDTGPQGAQGKLGDTGPQGAQGNLGDTGSQGVQGKLGPQGDQGVQGKIGPVGPVGGSGDNVVNSPVADDNMQPYGVVNYIIALQGIFPSRNSASPFLAEIIMFAGNFTPRGWAFCDGQILPINQNQSLFSILGTTYGGDGRTTFGLPDLRGRVAVHAGTGPGLTNRRLGAKGGSETEVPHNHDHTL